MAGYTLEELSRRTIDGGGGGGERPIAALEEAYDDVKATRIAEVNGRLVYVDEVPVRIPKYRPREVRLDRHPAEVSVPSWFDFLVETRDRRVSRHAIVIATYPYSSDWAAHARFKRAWSHHHSRADVERMKAAALEDSRGPRAYVESSRAPVDVDQSDTAVLSARIGAPFRSAPAATRPRARTRRSRLRVKGTVEATWVFGLCRDPDRLFDALLSSPAAAELRRRACDEGDLLEWYNFGESLEEESREEAEAVLRSSAWKALAGPAQQVGGWLAPQGAPAGPLGRLPPPGSRAVEDLFALAFVRAMEAVDRRHSAARV